MNRNLDKAIDHLPLSWIPVPSTQTALSDVAQVCVSGASFEQELKDQRYMPWRLHYLDYSQLYQCIYNISSPQVAAKRIEAEWIKVHDFFIQKRSEIERRLAACHLLHKEDHRQLPEQVKIVQSDIHRLYHFAKLNHLGFLKLFLLYDENFDSAKLLLDRIVFEDLSIGLFEWVYEINSLLPPLTGVSKPGPIRKYWVHPENVLEVMLYLSSRASIQTGSPSSLYPATHEKNEFDQCEVKEMTTVYFDTPLFTCYSERIAKEPKKELVRTRDYGQKDYVAVETKRYSETSKTEIHLTHKSLGKIPQYSQDSIFVEPIDGSRIDSRRWIKRDESCVLKNKSPVLKSTQKRTVFKTDETTIYVDTDVVMMHPNANESVYPYLANEAVRFPYCIVHVMGKELPELHASPLLESVYDFSVYLHGVGTLFSDKVHLYPQWLQYPLDDDLRRIPFRGDLVGQPSISLTINTTTTSSSSIQSSTIHTPWSPTKTIATFVTIPDEEKGFEGLHPQDSTKLLVPFSHSRRSSFRSFDTASSPLLSPAQRSFESYCTFDHPSSSRSNPNQCKNCMEKRHSVDYFCTPSRMFPTEKIEQVPKYQRNSIVYAATCLGVSFAASYLLYVVLMVF